jgi:phosphate/sulfate permease
MQSESGRTALQLASDFWHRTSNNSISGKIAANRSGVEQRTVNKFALAWLLILPATMLMSGLLLLLFRWIE